MRKIISHKRDRNLGVPSFQRFLELVDDIELRGHGFRVLGKRGWGEPVCWERVYIRKPAVRLSAWTIYIEHEEPSELEIFAAPPFSAA